MHISIASEVSAKADEMLGFKNPFISLQDLKCLCQGDEILEFCLDDLINYSLRYAETVCRFERIVSNGQSINEDGTRGEIERTRSTIHDSTIDAINILSRTLNKHGKDNKWITSIVRNGRPAYGKFAILIAFEVVIENKGGQNV